MALIGGHSTKPGSRYYALIKAGLSLIRVRLYLVDLLIMILRVWLYLIDLLIHKPLSPSRLYTVVPRG